MVLKSFLDVRLIMSRACSATLGIRENNFRRANYISRTSTKNQPQRRAQGRHNLQDGQRNKAYGEAKSSEHVLLYIPSEQY